MSRSLTLGASLCFSETDPILAVHGGNMLLNRPMIPTSSPSVVSVVSKSSCPTRVGTPATAAVPVTLTLAASLSFFEAYSQAVSSTPTGFVATLRLGTLTGTLVPTMGRGRIGAGSCSCLGSMTTSIGASRPRAKTRPSTIY